MKYQRRITSTPPDASGFVMMRRLRAHRLPVLALLALALAAAAGLLWLTPADSAQAQAQSTIWSAKLTVGVDNTYHGCDLNAQNFDDCSDALSDHKFRYKGTTYTVNTVFWYSPGAGAFRIWIDDGEDDANDGARIKNALDDLTLNVDGTPLAVADAVTETGGPIYWTYSPSTAWTAGQKVTLSLTAPRITVTSVKYVSTPPNGSFYRNGETIAFAVNFSHPVEALSENMFLNLTIGREKEVAYLSAGGGTNRWLFTEVVDERDVGHVAVRKDREVNRGNSVVTVPGAYVVMTAKTERKYRGTPVSFLLANIEQVPHRVDGRVTVPAPGYVSSASCNAAGTHCTVPYGWKPLPKHLREQPGASLRLMYLTTGKTIATSTNISAYNTFVKNEVPSGSPLYELRSQIRAMANAQQGDDLKTNTRTRDTDPGVWTPIFWVKGHHKKGKVADGYADLYDGSWDSSTVKGGKVSSWGGSLGHDPWVWTGSKSDGSPDYKPGTGGYDRRLGATMTQRGKALSEGQELYGNNPYASNDHPLGVGEVMYAITPILTISEAPYVPEAPANLRATDCRNKGVTLTWDGYDEPKRIWYYQYKWGRYWYEIMGFSGKSTSWRLDENYGAWGEGPPYGKGLRAKTYNLQIRAISDDEIAGKAAKVTFDMTKSNCEVE